MFNKFISTVFLLIFGTILFASGINTSPFNDDRTDPNVELLNQRQYKFYEYGYYPRSEDDGGNIYLSELDVLIKDNSRNTVNVRLMVHSTKEKTSRGLYFTYYNFSFDEKSWRRFMDSKLIVRTDDNEYVFTDESPRIDPPWLKAFSFSLEGMSVQDISDIVESDTLKFFIDIDELNIPAEEKIYIQRYFRDFILNGINYYDLDYLFYSGIYFNDEAKEAEELMKKVDERTKK